MNRDFKGIWIPKEIWLSKALTLQEKVFFVEIDSLDNEDSCFATNQYFADFFGLSKVIVSAVINSLVEKGYIKSTLIYREGSKEILKRVLKVSLIGYQRKQGEGIKGKFADSNTVNNTVNNTKRYYKGFLENFNTITKKKLRVLPDKARKQLNARLNEGFTIEEIEVAIKNAMNDKYHIENNFKYITPEFITRPDKLQMWLNASPKTQTQNINLDTWN